MILRNWVPTSLPLPRPEFPVVWDNTMRTALIECPQRFAYEHLYHFRPHRRNVHLHAGAAWATGLEVARRAFYVEGKDEEAALTAGLNALAVAYGDFEPPPKSPKSLPRMMDAFIYFFQRYSLSEDPIQPFVGPNGPMIEFSFVLPLGDDLLHPVTGDPILYSGRADMVALYAGACTIYDDKTTTSLGEQWGKQWDMRAQFSGYSWAAQQYGIPAKQIVARGMGILPTNLDTAIAISYREPWRTERWLYQIKRDIRRAMQLWQEGYWDLAEADACGSYGGCIFRRTCASPDPLPWLKTDFVRRRWDPVIRIEVDMEPLE